jgi:hypothetical protein
MVEFFDIVKTIYTKQNPIIEIDLGTNIALTKYLGRDKDNLPTLHKISKYLLYIEPLEYYYLLYLLIPRKYKIPYLKKIIKVEKEENKLLEAIRLFLKWSNKELSLHKKLLELTLLKNHIYWTQQLGVI